GAINIVTVNPSSSGAQIQLNGGSNFKNNEESNNKTYHSESVQILGSYASESQNHLVAGSIENGSGHRYNTALKNQKIFYQVHLSTYYKKFITVIAGFVYNNFVAICFYAAPINKESTVFTQSEIASICYKTKLTDRLSLKPQVNY